MFLELTKGKIQKFLSVTWTILLNLFSFATVFSYSRYGIIHPHEQAIKHHQLGKITCHSETQPKWFRKSYTDDAKGSTIPHSQSFGNSLLIYKSSSSTQYFCWGTYPDGRTFLTYAFIYRASEKKLALYITIFNLKFVVVMPRHQCRFINCFHIVFIAGRLYYQISPSYKLVHVGESAIITCKPGACDSKPIWIFNNPTQYHKMNISTIGYHLFLNDVSLYESGTYTCVLICYRRLNELLDHSFYDRAVVKVLGNACYISSSYWYFLCCKVHNSDL